MRPGGDKSRGQRDKKLISERVPQTTPKTEPLVDHCYIIVALNGSSQIRELEQVHRDAFPDDALVIRGRGGGIGAVAATLDVAGTTLVLLGPRTRFLPTAPNGAPAGFAWLSQRHVIGEAVEGCNGICI